MLVNALPVDSALKRDIPELGGWTTTDHLLALLIEVVDAAGWRAVLPHMKKGARPTPITVPRPASPPEPKRRATSDDLVRMFAGTAVYAPKEVTDGGS